MLQSLFAFTLVCQIKESLNLKALLMTPLHRLDVPDIPRLQTLPICWGVPKYSDASQNLGTGALSCSQSLWQFYLFCQLFLNL